MKRVALAIATVALLGATTAQMDSQVVLARYQRAVAAVRAPAVVVFSYTVSQTGPNNIEQHHRIYRSGLQVRDETLSIDGIPLLRKVVRFEQRADRYAVTRFAPVIADYQTLFLGTVKDGRHLDYSYETTPLNHGASVWIDRISIDGTTFLPRTVHFHTQSGSAAGSVQVEFGPFGSYWMPIAATASAQIEGKPAHERIAWSDYRFPAALPASTFKGPRPLPVATLPPI